MKKYSAYITLFGGFIAFYSFALPWQETISGAQLANSGEATIITGILICAFVIICISYSILKRETSWNTVSKLLALMISCLVLLIVILFLDRNITKFVVRILRLGMNISILVFALFLFGIIVYLTNRVVFLSYWKTGLALILGGGAILFCLYIAPYIVEYSINFIAINFIGTFAIIGISIYRLFRPPPYNFFSNFLLILCCCVGLSVFLIMFIGESLNLRIGGNTLYNPQYGMFLMSIGYITVLIGTLSYIKQSDGDKIQEEQNEITDS